MKAGRVVVLLVLVTQTHGQSVPGSQEVIDHLASHPQSVRDEVKTMLSQHRISPLYAAQKYVVDLTARHRLLADLLESGAAPDDTMSDGSTTLMLACEQGDHESAHLLLEHGADPLRRNHRGHDAVARARDYGHHSVSSLLYDYVGESGRRMAPAATMKMEL